MQFINNLWAKVDEKMFTLLWALITAFAIYFLAGDSSVAIIEIIVVKMIYVAILLVAALGMLYFLRGTQYDVYEEIFQENNVAAALLVASLFIAIATVIGK